MKQASGTAKYRAMTLADLAGLLKDADQSLHEYQHCFTEDDERASVRAELAFEATWPNSTYRVRAQRESRHELTHIDAEGHWRD